MRNSEITAQDGFWWLECAWQTHHNAIKDVHSLLVGPQREWGLGFMSVERVVAVLTAKDPEALVRSWQRGVATSLAGAAGQAAGRKRRGMDLPLDTAKSTLP